MSISIIKSSDPVDLSFGKHKMLVVLEDGRELSIPWNGFLNREMQLKIY